MKKGLFRLALVVLTVTAMLLGSVAPGRNCCAGRLPGGLLVCEWQIP